MKAWKSVDRFQRASQWLQNKRHAHLTREVTYRRGAASVTLLATVAATPFDLVTDAGAAMTIVSRDYILRAADLVLGGSAVTPRPGDFVDEVLAGATVSHQVLASAGLPHWRWEDHERTTIRVHTQEVGSS